jgi:hypothetical protein
VPTFSRTPASRTDPAVGASVWASGSQEEPATGGHRQGRGDLGERPQVERALAQRAARLAVEEQRADEQERGAGHREQEELHRRVDAVLTAPPADQQVHRDEDRLEEQEEQQQVEREERPEDGGLQHQHRAHVHPDVLPDRPRREDRDREQERGEQDEPQADPIHAHQVLQAGGPDPPHLFDQLIPLRRPVEVTQDHQRGGERHERDEQREDPRVRVRQRAPGKQQHHQSRERQEDHDAQEVLAHRRHPT